MTKTFKEFKKLTEAVSKEIITKDMRNELRNGNEFGDKSFGKILKSFNNNILLPSSTQYAEDFSELGESIYRSLNTKQPAIMKNIIKELQLHINNLNMIKQNIKNNKPKK